MKNDYHESESHKQVRLREAELMREAAALKGCRRCGGVLDDPYALICLDCDYNDWHEEIPEVLPQEDSDAS